MIYLWHRCERKYFSKIVDPVFRAAGEPFQETAFELGDMPIIPVDSVCVAMGKDALQTLQVNGLYPKNRALGSLRGHVSDLNGVKYLPTFSPRLAFAEYERRPEIVWDLNLAIRLARTGSIEITEDLNYQWVADFSEPIEWIKDHFSYQGVERRVPVTLDLETIGLDPFAERAKIVSVSVSVREGESFVINTLDGCPSLVRDQIAWLCSSDLVSLRGANLKYDMVWLMQHWGITDFSAHKFDTNLVGNLIEENRSNSLNLHTKIYVPSLGGYDDAFNDENDKDNMHEALERDPAAFLRYAGGDTDACLRVSKLQEREIIEDRDLLTFYTRLLRPASIAFAKLEHRGMLVDREEYARVREEIATSMAEAERAAIDMLPARMKVRHRGKLTLTRAAIKSDFLFSKWGLNLKPLQYTAKSTSDNPNPSTSLEHLKQVAKEAGNEVAREFVEHVQIWGAAKKTISTYVDGFLKHLRSDGRFHPTYILYHGRYDGDPSKDSGAVTGRTAVKAPAYQTIPKRTKWAKALRRVYPAPPGHVCLAADFSQGELRIVACVANEENMLQAYREDADVHLKTGLELYNLQYPDKAMTYAQAWEKKLAKDPVIADIRPGGKAGNFGLLYGMGVDGFIDYAWREYEVQLTQEEGEGFRNRFFETYPRLPLYHRDYKEAAHRYELVKSPLGRIRHLPLINTWDREIVAGAERQAINSPIQATLTDMGLLSVALIDQAYPDLWICGFTHDELVFYVPEDELDLWVKRIGDIMGNLPLREFFGWDHQIDFPAEFEFGPNRGKMEEWK